MYWNSSHLYPGLRLVCFRRPGDGCCGCGSPMVTFLLFMVLLITLTIAGLAAYAWTLHQRLDRLEHLDKDDEGEELISHEMSYPLKVSNLWDWDRFQSCQAIRQHCCRDAYHISDGLENFIPRSSAFEILWDLTTRPLMRSIWERSRCKCHWFDVGPTRPNFSCWV